MTRKDLWIENEAIRIRDRSPFHSCLGDCAAEPCQTCQENWDHALEQAELDWEKLTRDQLEEIYDGA